MVSAGILARQTARAAFLLRNAAHLAAWQAAPADQDKITRGILRAHIIGIIVYRRTPL